jgi:diaminopimelate epimerase
MRLRFTKMQGAGNDFVLLDATRSPVDLDSAQLRRLADRRFGVGADQILIVEPSAAPGVDFRYRIFNGASGDEVEQCGNGARCFVRFVRARGLSDKKTLVVETMNRRLELREQADGRVTVDMGAPDFEPLHVPFDTTWLAPRSVESGLPLWPVELGEGPQRHGRGGLDGQPACGAARRRRRCRAGRHARAAARAPRPIRARRQRRLHAGRRP